MSHDYSENILIRDSAGNVLRDELGWEVAMAYNSEKLGANGTTINFVAHATKARDRLLPKLMNGEIEV